MFDIDIYDYVKTALLENEFAQGGFIIALLTAIWHSSRSYPVLLWNRIVRHFTYSVTIEQSDELYVYVNQWLSDNYPEKMKNVEAFIVENFGTYNEATDRSSLKFRHFMDYFYTFYNGRLLKISKEREKMEAADNLVNAYLGRTVISGFGGKKAINKLLQDSLKYKKVQVEGKLKHYRYSNMGGWFSREEDVLKTVDNIFFPGKDEILDKIDRFTNSKDLYVRRGIMWKLGILLHGKPGSGKTSFAYALADYTKRNLYSLNLSSMTDARFRDAFTEMGTNSVLLLDDADICIPVRKSKDPKDLKLSTLLSVLSGTDSRSDVIVVMTTNNLEAFDEALIRKGRIDIIEEISYPDKKSLEQYLGNFYDVEDVIIESEVKDLKMVDVQDICLNSETLSAAVKKLK